MPSHLLNDTHIGSLSIFLQSSKATTTLDPDKNSSCLFYLNQVITAPPGTHMLVGLTSAEIPYSFYNVDSRNNKVTIDTANDGTATIILPEQNYDVDSLKKNLNNLLVAANILNTTVDFDKNTNKFTFTNTNGGLKITSTTMTRELGLVPNQINGPYTASLTSSNACNLSGTSSVYVNLNNVSITNLDSRGDLNGVLAKLNVNVAPSEFIFYQQTENQYYVTSDRQINFFSISLTDDNNELLNLNGVDFSVSITIHFQKVRLPVDPIDFLVDTRNANLEKQEKEKSKNKKNM